VFLLLGVLRILGATGIGPFLYTFVRSTFVWRTASRGPRPLVRLTGPSAS